MRQQVARINADLETLSSRIDKLLGTTVLSAAMSDGLEWRSWTLSRRRNLIRLLVARVVVAKWPEDMQKGLPKRRTESTDEHLASFEAHQREAIERRVTITPR